jgi:hypothetical protein
MGKRTIQEAIPIVAKALKGGVCEEIAWACMVGDGMSEKNADIVIRWAKQSNKAEDETISLEDWEIEVV